MSMNDSIFEATKRQSVGESTNMETARVIIKKNEHIVHFSPNVELSLEPPSSVATINKINENNEIFDHSI